MGRMKRPNCTGYNWEHFRPMKFAKPKHETQLSNALPLLGTRKMDGVRVVIRPVNQGDLLDDYKYGPLTYELNRIPNRHIFLKCSEAPLNLDAEIVTYTNGKLDKYHTVESKVMRRAGEPDFKLHVFDYIGPKGYLDRVQQLRTLDLPDFVEVVPVVVLETMEALTEFETGMINEGWEGIVVRTPDSLYKFGRSTPNEGKSFKIKRFEDAEAVVIGFTEMMRNENEQTVNAHGLSERSSHKAGKVPAGCLGTLICIGHNNVEFEIGSGFNMGMSGEQDMSRQYIWDHQDEFLMKVFCYKYQPHGEKEAPRLPIGKGWRRDVDPNTVLYKKWSKQ